MLALTFKPTILRHSRHAGKRVEQASTATQCHSAAKEKDDDVQSPQLSPTKATQASKIDESAFLSRR